MKQLITILKEIKTYSSRLPIYLSPNIWNVNIITDDRMDNNFIDRAPTKEKALIKAEVSLDSEMDYDEITDKWVWLVKDEEDPKEYWKYQLEDNDDEDFQDFINKKLDVYYLGSGT